MLKCRLLVLGCFFFAHQGWSQRYDSLLKAISQSRTDTTTLQLYHLLAEEIVLKDSAGARAYEDSALHIARRINNPKHISVTLTNIGAIYRNRSEYAKANTYYGKALEASPHFSPWLSQTFLEAGISLLRMSELDSSLSVLEQGMLLVKQHPNSQVEAALLNSLGNVKREQNRYEEAIDFYIRSLKIFEAKNDLKGQTQALSNISNMHNLMGDTGKALDYAMQSLETAKAAGVKSSVAYSYRLLGRIYRRQKKPDEALKVYGDALAIYQELQARRDVVETELSIGNIYFDKQDFEEAIRHYKGSLIMGKSIADSLSIGLGYVTIGNAMLELKAYDLAKVYIDSALVVVRKKKMASLEMDSYQLLSLIYEGNRKYELSLVNYRKYIHFRDSLEKEQNRLKAQEIEERYQSEMKDDAIRILNAENTLKSNQQKYLVVILILMLTLAVILYSRYNVKLKANKKLKELDLIKSRFFTNISHEFRTPLSLIIGPLEKKLTEARGESEKEGLNLMHRNARRLQNLINQLLDLSRIESGSMDLHLEERDLGETLRFIGSSFSSLAERKGIFYRQDIINSFIGCYDRDKLEKIINNLLSNAFKFTPEGGLVNFKTTLADGILTIEVKDSGIGIPEDQHDNIFNRFYQIDDSTVRSSEGSGIGLALTKELAELHRGNLSVASSEGIGSIFTVVIPVTRESFAGLPVKEPINTENNYYPSGDLALPVQAINDDESKPLVLIAEDNEDMQRFIVELLRDHYRTLSIVNGMEAYEQAQSVVPDLVVSDWMMPGMDGLTLCEKLKTTDATSHIPVLMLTARADQSSKLEGLETGADDYLTKPFDNQELLIRIHNLIEQRKKLRQLFSGEMVLQPKQISLPSRDAEFLSRLLSLLEKRHSDPDFNIDELSREVAMSRMQLHRKLKALTDQSPGELLRNFRLERAKQMLTSTGMQVSEVCYKAGFNNVSNFSKVFKEFTGVTPSEFAASATKEKVALRTTAQTKL